MATLEVTISGDASSLIEAAGASQAALGNLAGAASSASASVGGSGGGADDAASKFDKLFTSTERTGSGFREAGAAIRDIGGAFAATTGGADSAAASLSNVAGNAAAAAATGGEAGAVMAGVGTIFAQMASDATMTEVKLNTATAALASFGRSALEIKPPDFTEALSSIQSLMDKAGGATGNIGSFSAALREAQSAAGPDAYQELSEALDNLKSAQEETGSVIGRSQAISQASAQVQSAYAAAAKQSAQANAELAASESRVASEIQGLATGMGMVREEFTSAAGAVVVYTSALNLASNVQAPGTTMQSLLGHATGGPVATGTPYLVGERGPELFVPSSGGEIVSNGDFGMGMGGGGGTYIFAPNININGPSFGMTDLFAQIDAHLREASLNQTSFRGFSIGGAS